MIGLDIIGLIDTGCSNIILSSQFTTEQMDGQLFTYTTKLDRGKLSFYLPNGTLMNYIQVDNKISLRNLQLRHIKLILGLNLFFTLLPLQAVSLPLLISPS